MSVFKRVSGLLSTLALLSVCWLSAVSPVAGQTSGPTPDQLQMFQGLSPDQQSSIMQAITGGGGLSGGGLGALGAQQQMSPDQISREMDRRQQMLDQLAQRNRPKNEEDLQQPEVIPQLKSQDWVIVEIDYQLPPRPVPPYLQALYSSQASARMATPAAPSQLAARAAGQGSATEGATPNQAAALAAAASGLPSASGANSSGDMAAGTGSGSGTGQTPLTDEERTRLDALIALVR
ncbi:MAG TPA: hypothetical protein VID49_05455, partial [Steroidobacteraceae bacterium]